MADNWASFSTWHLVLPPNRPTMKYLNLIGQMAQSLPKSPSIAVLGATPELRDLARRLEPRQIFVFERDLAFMNMVAPLKALPIDRETIVHGDWLETLPLYEKQFDLVLSDLTSGNVNYSDRGNFYNFISRSLAAGGLFIDRMLVDDFERTNIEDLERKYLELPLNLQVFNDYSSEFLFCSTLAGDLGLVDSTLFYQMLLERPSHAGPLQAQLRGARLVTPEGCKWYYGLPWMTIKSNFYQAFSSIETAQDQAGTVFSNRTRIFTCRGDK